MASLKDIRARIESTKNTQQITKAMKMVSAAKLRRAQNNIVNMRPYAKTLIKVIADIAVTQRIDHPLLTPRSEPKKILVVVLSSDRGLCAGFNANINKFVDLFYKANVGKFEKLDFLFIGKKSAEFFQRRKLSTIEVITKLDREISSTLAGKVAHGLMDHYLKGNYDEIRVVYNEFRSAISQVVVCETLLPVDLSKQTFDKQQGPVGFAVDMIFEPSPELIIEDLLKKHFSIQVYRCMSESVAAEHGARMSAMESATNNAKAMINSLTLTYNKLRQEKITTELIEITTGAEALK
ncbi:MAG: synthase subunit gamma [Pseudomonadota bacterium]|jgi:F-type H+-transporting ATPase subunit gamma